MQPRLQEPLFLMAPPTLGGAYLPTPPKSYGWCLSPTTLPPPHAATKQLVAPGQTGKPACTHTSRECNESSPHEGKPGRGCSAYFICRARQGWAHNRRASPLDSCRSSRCTCMQMAGVNVPSHRFRTCPRPLSCRCQLAAVCTMRCIPA